MATTSPPIYASARTIWCGHDYLGLLYQNLLKAGQLTSQGKLPPVLPQVLYNGERAVLIRLLTRRFGPWTKPLCNASTTLIAPSWSVGQTTS